MWQQMLIMIILIWIVGAPGVLSITNTSMITGATSFAPPNRNNHSVTLNDKNLKKNMSMSTQLQQKGGINPSSVIEPIGSSGSGVEVQTPNQSESSSSVLKDVSKISQTESPNTTTDRGNLTEVSSYSPDIIETKNITFDSDIKADSRDLGTNDTYSKVGKDNDQDSGKVSGIPTVSDQYQFSGNKSGINSNNASEGEKNEKEIKIISTTEPSRSSGSLVSPPPDQTNQNKYPKLPKKSSTTFTTTITTVAVDESNEDYLKSPFQDMDEIGDVDNGSQSSAMKNIPVSDEKYNIQDLQGLNEDFDENPIENEKKIPMKVDNGGKFTDDEDSHFFAYFLTIMVTAIIFYLIFHNKQRIIALIIEGRAPNSRGRRSSRKVRYHKLDNNLEEAITATKGAKYDRIY